MTYILVGLGGALGGIARYTLAKHISRKYQSVYPASTFIINVTGALLLGVVTALNLPDSLALLFVTGFLGAYTTFSTFVHDAYGMFRNGLIRSVVYIGATLLLGLAGFAAGNALTRLLVA